MLETCVAERKNGSSQQNCTAAEPGLILIFYMTPQKAEKAATL